MPRTAAAGFVLAATGLVLIVVLVAACGPATGPASPSGRPAGSSAPTDPGSSSRAASPGSSGSAAASTSPNGSDAAVLVWLPEWAGSDVPESVAARRPVPFCGVERAPAPQPGIFIDRAVRLCFWNAHLAGQEAEFVSLQTTIEGDPIATVYRLASDGTVQVLTDSTQDRFGSGAWQLQDCERVVTGEGQELLGVADCVDRGILQ